MVACEIATLVNDFGRISMGVNYSMTIDFHTRCELGVTLQTANATAKEPSQWQLERVEANEANQ
jgi:hypothetical protein